MFENLVNKPSVKTAPKGRSGVVTATILAINPTGEQYEQLTGRALPFTPDYTPSEVNKGTPIRVLVSAAGEFLFVDLTSLNTVEVAKKDGTGFQYINGRGAETWKADIESARAEIGDEARVARQGEAGLYRLLAMIFNIGKSSTKSMFADAELNTAMESFWKGDFTSFLLNGAGGRENCVNR